MIGGSLSEPSTLIRKSGRGTGTPSWAPHVTNRRCVGQIRFQDECALSPIRAIEPDYHPVGLLSEVRVTHIRTEVRVFARYGPSAPSACFGAPTSRGCPVLGGNA